MSAKRITPKHMNFKQSQAARARRLRTMKKQPTPEEVEAALALASPLGHDTYARLRNRIDLDKLQRGEKAHEQ